MKRFALTFFAAVVAATVLAQNADYHLSSHILDITKGTPAAGVTIKLERYDEKGKTWNFVAEKVTDKNGRITDFLPSAKPHRGIFKLTYLTQPYFQKSRIESFYPFIEVVFRIKDEKHYHVPITLSAYGYSTYRGN